MLSYRLRKRKEKKYERESDKRCLMLRGRLPLSLLSLTSRAPCFAVPFRRKEEEVKKGGKKERTKTNKLNPT
jgi:hypothetical protein